ncbi:hypothetical protein [Microvirga sesbaniae]|nr:hypothetical protein [Microvirga sp. HBU67692]
MLTSLSGASFIVALKVRTMREPTGAPRHHCSFGGARAAPRPSACPYLV